MPKTKRKKSRAPRESYELIGVEEVLPLVRIIRGEQVILDSDIAELYGVTTGALNQAVRRNPERFPADFMFQLAPEEFADWKSQIVISNPRRAKMGLRRRPYAFTEEGVAMLSGVLRSERAVRVNIAIMRSFVQMRRALASKELLLQVAELERKYGRQFKNVFEALHEFQGLFRAIYLLLSPPEPGSKPRPIGFGAYEQDEGEEA